MRRSRSVLLLSISSILFICCAASPVKPPELTGTIIREDSSDWGTLLWQDTYKVMNNVWHKNAAKRGTQKVFLEKLDGQDAFGWQWDWSSKFFSRWAVVAYPEIQFGENPWADPLGTKSPFPFRAGEKKMSADMDISFKSTGVCNLAFSIWVITDPLNPKKTVSHEVMIWIAHNDFYPAGKVIDTIVVGDNTFKMYYRQNHGDNTGVNQNTWDYIAFFAERPVLQGRLDLNAFIDCLMGKQLLTKKNYITCVELGNEIVHGTGLVEIKKYKINVE